MRAQPVLPRRAARSRYVAGRAPARYSWDLHALLGSGKLTLEQVLDAFRYDYSPVLRDGRPRATPTQPLALAYCKGR
jgi:hypothetical protein